MRLHSVSSKSAGRVRFALLLFLGCCSIPGSSATLAYQNFGQSNMGVEADQTVNIPAVSPGPAAVSLQYSIDFSIGACTPNGNGCSLPVSFIPTKPGLRQDAVIVKDANGQVIEEVLLSGVGLGPLPVFSPGLATLKALITPDNQLPQVQGIAPQPDATILILRNNVISRVDPAANSLVTVLSPPTATASTAPSLYTLATDATGSIYFVNGNAEMHRFDVATQTYSLVASNVSINGSSLIVSPSGTIFYAQGDRIYQIAPNTNTPMLFAGNGSHSFSGDNGPALQAAFAAPSALALDLAGNLYVADTVDQRVRKINTAGIVSTVAGNGVIADLGDGGLALNASLDFPEQLAVDTAGDVYVGTLNGFVRRIDAGTGLISTVAGATPQIKGFDTDQNPFFGAGYSASAQDITAGPMAFTPDGNLWVATTMDEAKVALFEISTAATARRFPLTAFGQSQSQSISLLNAGTADLTQPVFGTSGPGAGAFSPSSNCPSAVAPGTSCTLNVTFTAGGYATPVASVNLSDNAVSSPQIIPVSGASGGPAPATLQVSAVSVGSSSPTPQPLSVQFPGNATGLTATLAYGNEFTLGVVSCTGSNMVSCSAQITFAPLYPGLRTDAIQFADSTGAVVYQCFLSGLGQGPQWLVDMGAVSSFPLPSTAAIKLSAIDLAGNLYAVAPLNAGQVYRFNRQTKQWTVVAGQSDYGADTGDGGLATNATLSSANAVALDSAGNMFIAEALSIRRVDGRSGIITTVAQEGADSLAIDQNGEVYFGNSFTNKVRRLDLSSGAIVTVAGTGQRASTGNGGLATAAALESPRTLAFDNTGNLLIGDLELIRKVDLNSGVITANGSSCGSSSIALDSSNNLYLPCGQISFASAGGGTPRTVETSFYNIFGSMLRSADGTFYSPSGASVSAAALPSPINLSAVVNGSSSTAGTTLTNVGNIALTIASVSVSGVNASAFSQSNTCAASLAPAQSCTISPTFKAAQIGSQTATLTITSNAPALRATLNGTGVQTSVNISPQTVTFGNVPTSASVSQQILIQNVGPYQFALTSALITGPNAADFTVGSTCPSVPTNVGYCYVTATFQPRGAGSRTATLTLADDATGSPHTVALSGSGVPNTAGNFLLVQGTSINFGVSTLSMQINGNLSLYQGSFFLWSTGTGGQNCGTNQCQAVFQSDGNLVVYNGSAVLWSSGTYGHPDAKLVFSSLAPRLQIVDSHNSILWSNVTGFQAGNLTLMQGMFANLDSSGTLVMQNDGNLVLYQGGSAIWNTGTYGQDCSANQCVAIFQGDGNLVVYNGAAVLWSSGTYGNSQAGLYYSATAPHLQIYSVTGSVLWTDVPAFQAGNLALAQGEFAQLGSSSLVMQTDGNLVLYRNGAPLWSTGTYGQSCGANQCQTIFQTDGNLVVYKGSTALWSSGTYGNPAAQLTYSKAGAQLQIISSDQKVLWNRP